jgi:hypothetical protein
MSGRLSLPAAPSLKLGSASLRSGSASPSPVPDSVLLPACWAPALSSAEADCSPLAPPVCSSGGPVASLVWPGGDWLLDSLPLAGELAEGWLGLLVLELPGELLELLVGGGVLLGVGGVCGCVGLLALGQPDRSRQRQVKPPMLLRRCNAALLKVKCFDNLFCLYWLSRLETWPEGGLAQLPHQARGLSVLLLIVIHALQILHPPPLTHTES